MTVHYTAWVAQLSAITPIPSVCQPIIGTAIDIDYMIELDVDHDPGETIRIGLTITDTEQTILEYNRSATGATHVRCKLRYATLDLTDSTFVLEDADMHDCRDGHANKEAYLAEAHEQGVTVNRRRVVVMRAAVISVSRLADIVTDLDA